MSFFEVLKIVEAFLFCRYYATGILLIILYEIAEVAYGMTGPQWEICDVEVSVIAAFLLFLPFARLILTEFLMGRR